MDFKHRSNKINETETEAQPSDSSDLVVDYIYLSQTISLQSSPVSNLPPFEVFQISPVC